LDFADPHAPVLPPEMWEGALRMNEILRERMPNSLTAGLTIAVR
jgi:hypothetical protein